MMVIGVGSENENKKSKCCAKSKPIMDNETGEIFCANCGSVISSHAEDTGREWRAFSIEEYEGRSRTGIPTSLAMHDMGLATVIGSADKDFEGKPLSTAIRSTIERLRTWDSRSQVHEPLDRNLRQAMFELDKLKDKLGVGESVIERTAYIYRKVLEKGLVKGRSISALITAALYAACRDTETPRTLKDIANASNLKRKEITRAYRLIVRELDLHMPVVDPIKCVSRIANSIQFSSDIRREKTKRKAIEILNKAKETRISIGKDPMGLAATALYIACRIHGEEKTQKDVAEAAGVTEVTIRNNCKRLEVLITNANANTNTNTNANTNANTNVSTSSPTPTPSTPTTTPSTPSTISTISTPTPTPTPVTNI